MRPKIIPLKTARAAGLIWYYPGPCGKGHERARRVSNRNCPECIRLAGRGRVDTRTGRKRTAEQEKAHRQRPSAKRAKKEWAKRNRAIERARWAKYNAAKKQATVVWANDDAIKLLYVESHARPGTHVDHIVPLQSPLVCGLHCDDNLQVLPGPENQRKSNRTWPDMP